jgi:hypothetical protein
MAGERLLLADALLVLADLIYVLLALLVLSDLIIPATCVLDMLLGRSLRWRGVG